MGCGASKSGAPYASKAGGPGARYATAPAPEQDKVTAFEAAPAAQDTLTAPARADSNALEVTSLDESPRTFFGSNGVEDSPAAAAPAAPVLRIEAKAVEPRVVSKPWVGSEPRVVLSFQWAQQSLLDEVRSSLASRHEPRQPQSAAETARHCG